MCCVYKERPGVCCLKVDCELLSPLWTSSVSVAVALCLLILVALMDYLLSIFFFLICYFLFLQDLFI